MSEQATLLGRLRRLRRPTICLMVLLPFFAAAYYLAFWLRFEGELGTKHSAEFLYSAAWVVLTKAIVFGLLGVYRGWSRFVTFYDLGVLAKATAVSFLVNIVVWRFVVGDVAIARAVWVLDAGCTLLLVGGLRAGFRVFRERSFLRWAFLGRGGTPVLIVGVNHAGESLLRSIQRSQGGEMRPVGLLDTNPARVGSSVSGVPILGTLESAADWVRRRGVRKLLVAADRLTGREIRQLIQDVAPLGAQVRLLPSHDQLLRGKVDIRPRAVDIDDLLRREPVELEMDDLHQWLDGRTLMVTGSAGSIGSEIARQLLRFSPKRLVLVDRWETGQFFLGKELQAFAETGIVDVRVADVLDATNMRRIMRECPCDVVFHAAAYKHVPLMEDHPGEAVKNIVLATQTLADLAVETGAGSFVMVSTDKAVNPTSVMGACKRAAELYVQSLAGRASCRFVTVRFGNVLDSSGSVVPVFRQQIASGGPVTITHPNIERFFMTIPEASQLVIQAGAIGHDGEIMVLDMGQPVRIVDLAEDMIRLSGLEPHTDIEIEFIGLRPGEKLYEELHAAEERRLATRHSKIMIADAARPLAGEVAVAIERLVALARHNPSDIVGALAEIIPGYAGYRSDRRRAA